MTPMQKAVEAAIKELRGNLYDSDYEHAHVIITAALSALEAEGWKLMPREATDEMKRNGWEALKAVNLFQARYGNSLAGAETKVHEAMYASAPKPE